MKPTFVRRATPDDLKEVAYRLRQEDVEEVRAATGLDPRLVLTPGATYGREVLAAGLTYNDRAEILYGIDPWPCSDNVGIIWMLSTPVIYDHPVEFVVMTQRELSRFHERYELLTNFIDARNEKHIKWLSWMGFKKLRTIESFGAQSLPFIEFASYRPCA